MESNSDTIDQVPVQKADESLQKQDSGYLFWRFLFCNIISVHFDILCDRCLLNPEIVGHPARAKRKMILGLCDGETSEKQR